MRRCVPSLVVVGLVALLALVVGSTEAAAQAAGLKIVVIAGEGAVNVIQQKTATAPVVEVRDRNGQPVAGAVVRFAIRGGRASFNGARALSVTTNAAGRATVSSLTPATSGAFEITASAAFQGQTAVATIVQTNVMTAAQATGVAAGASGAGGTAGGAAGGGGAGAGAGGAGAGGGLSATTIGVVAGAAAGGTLVAVNAAGTDWARYEGTFTADAVMSITNSSNGLAVGSCSWKIVIAGTMALDLSGVSGTLDGHIDATWTETEVSRTCSSPLAQDTNSWNKDVRGPAAALQFNQSFNGPGSGSTAGTVTRTQTFAGALNGDAVIGTLTFFFQGTGTAPNGNAVAQGYPPTSAAVTLQKVANQ